MGKLSALELAKQINHSVNYALPIGPANIKSDERGMSSQERTGDWSLTVVRALRKGGLTFRWSEPGWKHHISSDDEYLLPIRVGGEFFGQYSNSLANINIAVLATLNKAGNCGEMASLAMVYLCQYACSYLSLKDKFSFEIMVGDGQWMDHDLVRIFLNGTWVICDPWLKFACEINAVGLAELKKKLILNGALKLEDQWDEFARALMNPNFSEKYCSYYVDLYPVAQGFVKHFEAHYQLARQYASYTTAEAFMKDVQPIAGGPMDLSKISMLGNINNLMDVYRYCLKNNLIPSEEEGDFSDLLDALKLHAQILLTRVYDKRGTTASAESAILLAPLLSGIYALNKDTVSISEALKRQKQWTFAAEFMREVQPSPDVPMDLSKISKLDTVEKLMQVYHYCLQENWVPSEEEVFDDTVEDDASVASDVAVEEEVSHVLLDALKCQARALLKAIYEKKGKKGRDAAEECLILLEPLVHDLRELDLEEPESAGGPSHRKNSPFLQ